MPIYEFRCVKCEHTQEKLFTTPIDLTRPMTACEKCGGVSKLVPSKGSFRLMPGGSGGFYSPSKS